MAFAYVSPRFLHREATFRRPWVYTIIQWPPDSFHPLNPICSPYRLSLHLVMAEYRSIIMETFATSDLQFGMTGKLVKGQKRTNYSSFPRVVSAFGITQDLGYLIAGVESGVGGSLTRNLGQQAATGVMARILLILSVMLLGILVRFRDVQGILDSKKD
jgi:hypothetical protein